MSAQTRGRLAGKVGLVTGGASGIGEATARAFVEQGARVIIADVRADAARSVAKELGGPDVALGVGMDVSVEKDVAAGFDAGIEAFGYVDVAFLNAGILGASGPISQTPVEDWDRTLDVLVKGPFLGIKHAARVMEPLGRGAIVLTSSIAGLAGGIGSHAYTTAKTAVVGLTRSAASELCNFGIRVNAVAPGTVPTNMTIPSGDEAMGQRVRDMIAASSPLGIAGSPRDVADAVVYLSSDESRYVSGVTIAVDAGHLAGGTMGQFHKGEGHMTTGIAGDI